MATPSTDYVKKFNALFHGESLHHECGPADPECKGDFPNEWHFDIRYIALPSFVGHLLVLSLHESNFHFIPMPLEANFYDGNSYLSTVFFPESGSAAAPETVRIIMNAFLHESFGSNANFTPNNIAPFNLTTTDEDLAVAVAAEFKRLGAHSGLHSISCKSSTSITQISMSRFFGSLKAVCGFSSYESGLFQVPEPLNFSELRITDPLDPFTEDAIAIAEGLSRAERVKYYQCRRFVDEWALLAPRLPDTVAIDTRIAHTREIMDNIPTPSVKNEADDNECSYAALDYGIRARTGFGCARDREVAYEYLMRVILCSRTRPYHRAKAHSALIHWNTNAQAGQIRAGRMDRRYLLAACYHANAAASVYRELKALEPSRAVPERLPASPRVLTFMNTVFKEYIWEYPETTVLAKVALCAQRQHYQNLLKESPLQRFERSPRYLCASIECNRVVDSGTMLRQCAGGCDRIMKPRYCSRQCQKTDWKNHKPFCSSGAPCSVIDEVVANQGDVTY